MDQTEERVTRETTEKDGQIKCPKCGATDISTDIKTGKLRCNFCRHLFEPEKAEDSGDIADLEGSKVSEKAQLHCPSHVHPGIYHRQHSGRVLSLHDCGRQRPLPFLGHR